MLSESRRPACSSDGRFVQGATTPAPPMPTPLSRESTSDSVLVWKRAHGSPLSLWPSYGCGCGVTTPGEECKDIGEFELDLEDEGSQGWYSACCFCCCAASTCSLALAWLCRHCSETVTT